jgi:hypothetical protein
MQAVLAMPEHPKTPLSRFEQAGFLFAANRL